MDDIYVEGQVVSSNQSNIQEQYQTSNDTREKETALHFHPPID